MKYLMIQMLDLNLMIQIIGYTFGTCKQNAMALWQIPTKLAAKQGF